MSQPASRRTRPSRPSSAVPLRARLAIVLLAAVALLPALSLTLQLVQNGWQYAEDSIGAFDQRLSPLREHLQGQSSVGYLPPAGSLEAPGGAAHFYMTRYALAPVVVVNQTQRPLVVADGVADPSRLAPGLVVAHDFGAGLLLLRPGTP